MNTARDRPVLGNFRFHLVYSLDLVVVTDVIARVTDGPAFVLAVLSSRGWRPSAVFAFINGRDSVLQVVSDVLLA